ncbi:MAG: PilT/PilU family type 4a pilus ATPase [Polyangiaceae bacterium]|nr:PilT/PilU family type 4a pilus ATPase [Polyangiaceae bacterium]
MPAIDPLFDDLLDRGGSDLHLAVGHPPLVRLAGELAPLAAEPVSIEQMEQLLFELLDDERRNAFESLYDLDFAYSYGSRARFRANYFFELNGPAAVFHHISNRSLDPTELGIPPVVLDLARRPAGLVLVAGTAGSGKTTTLAAMVSHLNQTRSASILTIEDPVEFVHTPVCSEITHREIGFDAPSFRDALCSATREGADVVVIGRLDDSETMVRALELAAAGTLVLSTMQSGTVTATVERFIDAAPVADESQVRSLLGEAIAGVVAQQLVPRADGRGRAAAHEILVSSPAVAAAIREAKTAALVNLMHAGVREGMQTMDTALERLVAAGTITARDALERAQDKQSFARLPVIAAERDLREAPP